MFVVLISHYSTITGSAAVHILEEIRQEIRKMLASKQGCNVLFKILKEKLTLQMFFCGSSLWCIICIIISPSLAVNPGCVCQCGGSSSVWGWTLNLQPADGNRRDGLLYPWVMDASVWPCPHSFHIHCCPGGPTHCRGECYTSTHFFKLFHSTNHSLIILLQFPLGWLLWEHGSTGGGWGSLLLLESLLAGCRTRASPSFAVEPPSPSDILVRL